MGAILVIGIIVAACLVVVALVRGLSSFANMRPDDLDENGTPRSANMQNKMMFARVKWQAIAIVLVALLLIFSQAR
ncbi:HIG1 domain-containing protein [Novosphingopyxis sp.]|uniref:HIG1 domain-containing protein n=1 Tax=Novosphingopyxis sp. TaxID=2709690 RepID=UPI003B5BC002